MNKLAIASVAGAAFLLGGCSCFKRAPDVPPAPMPVKANYKGAASCKGSASCKGRQGCGSKSRAGCSGHRM